MEEKIKNILLLLSNKNESIIQTYNYCLEKINGIFYTIGDTRFEVCFNELKISLTINNNYYCIYPKDISLIEFATLVTNFTNQIEWFKNYQLDKTINLLDTFENEDI